MNFEWTLAAWARVRPAVCYLAPRCGRNLIMESNGDVFSCDHFMYPAYRLGNILEDGLEHLIDSEQQLAFALRKKPPFPTIAASAMSFLPVAVAVPNTGSSNPLTENGTELPLRRL